MAWTYFPVNPGDDLQLYDRLIELWKACRERAWALGVEFFPRTNLVWDSGTIGSLSQNGDDTWTLTDSSKDWQPLPFCSGDRWVDYVCTNAPWLPRNYDVVIDYDLDDPRTCVRGRIVANTPSTLNLSDLTDYATAKVIPSVSALVGKKYHIIKRDGLWWNDRSEALGRWLDWPNDQELDKGTVTSSTTTTLSVAGKRWSVNHWAGKEALVFAGGKLQRRAILSNTPDTLTFSAMPAAPAGEYVIVAAGGKAMPGRAPAAPFGWYGGALDSCWSHHPNDVLGSTPIPAATVSWSSGDECETTSHVAFDVDVWSGIEEECSEADRCYSPRFYKSLRGLQVWLEEMCYHFVEAKDYDGLPAIPNFTPATWFKAAGINAGTSSVAGPNGGGNYFFSVSSNYEGCFVYWTVLKESGDTYSSGIGAVVDGKVTLSNDVNLLGLNVVYSAGWTRFHPLEFTYLYERAAFIPDTDGESVVDPPQVENFAESGCFGVGRWIKRGPSAAYKTYGEDGLASDAGDAFNVGDCARHVGDNWHDPGTGIVASGAMPADLPYWDHFFEGQHSKPPFGNMQAQAKADRLGVSTGGTNHSLTDSNKNWWNPHWYAGGVLRVESGVATGGSSTHLQIEAAKADTEDPSHCFWQATRFVGFTSPYVEFILEVDKLVGEEIVTYKLPITAVSGRNVQFAAVAGLTVIAGDAYRIREPKYNLNRFKGRTLKLIDPANGNSHEVTITYNDDTTLFFAPPVFTVGPDWSYEVIEHDTGGVWKWDGAKWLKPTGTDPRGVPWHSDQTENLPHKVKRYGRFTKGDYVTIELLNELHTAINALRHTKKGLMWKSRANPAIPENNQRNSVLSTENAATVLIPIETWDDAKGYAELGWSDNARGHLPGDTFEVDSAPPFARASGQWQPYEWDEETLDSFTASLQRGYAYGLITEVPTSIPHQVDWYAYAEASASGEDLSSTPPNVVEFDANGDGLAFRVFKRWDSTGETSEASTRSDPLGNTSLPQPNWCEAPDNSGPEQATSVKGYFVSNQQVVLKWSMVRQ